LQPLPLRGFDEEVRKFVTEQYELHGLKLHPEATPTEIQKGADGKLTLISESKQHGKVVLEGLDQVLLATGRKPNTKNLGCEEVPASSRSPPALHQHCSGTKEILRMTLPLKWQVCRMAFPRESPRSLLLC